MTSPIAAYEASCYAVHVLKWLYFNDFQHVNSMASVIAQRCDTPRLACFEDSRIVKRVVKRKR
ncbi:hypothetical protein DXD71_04970 [Bifidobacterium pseudocatenulatum]|nr:hypothetical protein DXD87_03870 [Bifidobacterium pseudocatenulatum]RGJ12564.1 hypothetical protein DXD75_01570 [Bifidobacterium pseudocatenulatum]RGJ16471.1 hypothetical protein DXD71_04970 [Bifidobacterium pseudocatenulatum]RGK16119.1 hypothetical protein DXD29_05455 [Bifidobacterium pseudocatenulatum]RGM15213.1 hypothetical protein DXC29_00195 [Bifidobacterium pseudocatenulatum]